MFRGMSLRQRILDGTSIALCLITVAAVLIAYGRLPDRIPMHFSGSGAVTGYGGKANLFVLLGVAVLMTGTFSACVRIPRLYRNVNLPWTVPWGRMPLIVTACRDMMAAMNLCCTAGNVYLICVCMFTGLPLWPVWLPYAAVTAVLIWFLARCRAICRR